MRLNLRYLAALGLLLACAAPGSALAMNDRDASEVNRKLTIIRLDESFAKSEQASAVAMAANRDDACAHLKRGVVYANEAVVMANDIKKIIGPDALHEHADVFKMLGAVYVIGDDFNSAIREGCQ
jgi:hypothetical protein